MMVRGFAVSAFLLLLVLLFVFTVDAKDKKYPKENDFVAVESGPEMTKVVTPEYPVVAKANKIEGTVWLKVLVDDDGTVVEAKVVKSSGKDCGFEEAALEAAKKCEYLPAKQDSLPVAVWVAYPVKFVLAEDTEK